MSGEKTGGGWIVGGLFVSLATLAAGTRPASAAVSLGAISQPTLQLLIDLGDSGVISNGVQYYDFSYAATAGAPPVDAVTVQPVGTGDDSGLRFVASWVDDGGSIDSSTISFDVTPLDGGSVARLGLTSNGTAPVTAAGTFVTATASAATTAGTSVGPVVSTYDDGVGLRADVDSAAATLDAPQSLLAVTDTLTAVSSTGGVATASFVQNGFTITPAELPEPAIGFAVVWVGFGRRSRRSRPASR
jgi:hypothetical protein